MQEARASKRSGLRRIERAESSVEKSVVRQCCLLELRSTVTVRWYAYDSIWFSLLPMSWWWEHETSFEAVGQFHFQQVGVSLSHKTFPSVAQFLFPLMSKHSQAMKISPPIYDALKT